MPTETNKKNTRTVKDQSIYQNSLGILTVADVQKKLEYKARKMANDEVAKFKNGNYASIFSIDEMTALAEDIVLEIANRIQIYQTNPLDPKAVNPRGMHQYFHTSFINHCQKIYEKHAKTDSRAGVMTISSDEALSVAASKNLIYPENKYMLMKEFEHVINELEAKDAKANDEVKLRFEKIGKTPKVNDFSHNAYIIEKTLEGYSPGDIRDQLGLTEVEYANHRKNALLTSKECFAATYADLREHFDASIDHRFYYSEVKKRLKKEKRMLADFNLKKNFYIENVYDKTNNIVHNKLLVKIDYMNGDDKSKDVASETFTLKQVDSTPEESSDINKQLWDESKHSHEISKQVDDIVENIRKEKTIHIGSVSA